MSKRIANTISKNIAPLHGHVFSPASRAYFAWQAGDLDQGALNQREAGKFFPQLLAVYRTAMPLMMWRTQHRRRMGKLPVPIRKLASFLTNRAVTGKNMRCAVARAWIFPGTLRLTM